MMAYSVTFKRKASYVAEQEEVLFPAAVVGHSIAGRLLPSTTQESYRLVNKSLLAVSFPWPSVLQQKGAEGRSSLHFLFKKTLWR